MLKKFINTILYRRNFWRNASNSEIVELYLSRIFRIIATNLSSSFISIYMFKMGYSILYIVVFWAIYYLLKAFIVLPVSQIVASIGAKKSIIISNILYVPSILAFIMLPEWGEISLFFCGVLMGISVLIYNIAHLVAFSRVNRISFAGKQVAMMNIYEKIANGASPLIGGLIAMFFDPRISMISASLFFLLASMPLMRSPETMETGFKIRPRHFPWKVALGSLLVQIPIGFDIHASSSIWTIFLAAFIFVEEGNQVYAQLGFLTSFILVISLISTHFYGKIIDRSNGGKLLFWSSIGGAVVNIFRAVVKTPVSAVGTNTVREITATGYSMAFMRGMFDVANQTHYRVLYMGLSELFANIGALIASLLFIATFLLFEEQTAFTVFYFITAVMVFLIAFSKFKLYKR